MPDPVLIHKPLAIVVGVVTAVLLVMILAFSLQLVIVSSEDPPGIEPGDELPDTFTVQAGPNTIRGQPQPVGALERSESLGTRNSPGADLPPEQRRTEEGGLQPPTSPSGSGVMPVVPPISQGTQTESLSTPTRYARKIAPYNARMTALRERDNAWFEAVVVQVLLPLFKYIAVYILAFIFGRPLTNALLQWSEARRVAAEAARANAEAMRLDAEARVLELRRSR